MAMRVRDSRAHDRSIVGPGTAQRRPQMALSIEDAHSSCNESCFWHVSPRISHRYPL